jgi:hypothetical protein
MRPTGHMVTSAISAGVVGIGTHSVGAAVACFMSGVLIDLDHFLDYILARGFTFSYKKFSQAMYQLELPRYFLVLHSYEFIVLFWIWIILTQAAPIWIGIGVGTTIHVLMDQLFNKRFIAAYCFTYRALKGFKKSALMRTHSENS